MDNKRPILLLGSRGLLGSEIAKVYQNQNLYCIDKDDIDVTDKLLVNNLIMDVNPQMVINAAAYTNVDEAERNQCLADKVNAEAVSHLAKICKSLRIILVHYSTDYVFGGEQMGYLESDIPKKPINYYGESKLLGEIVLRKYNNMFYLIRLSSLFGLSGINFVDKMLDLAEDKQELKIVNDQYFKPTYAPDLAKATKNLLDEKPEFGVYHLTNEGITTWHSFAKSIFHSREKLTNKKSPKIIPCSSNEFRTLAKRPKYSILLNTKFHFLRHWRMALEDYLKIRLA